MISSGCPTVTRLISVRFPELAENVIPLNQPMEIMAKLARERMEQDGYPKEEIGIFLYCPLYRRGDLRPAAYRTGRTGD